MGFSWFWSRQFLFSRSTLWLVTLFYIPGTIYGYIWYGDQLKQVWTDQPAWLIPFVPDSPTASLFFIVALLWLWIRPAPSSKRWVNSLRGLIEALGVVTSVKYGIWATVIIVWGYMQGDPIVWQHWMLIIGHLAMAVMALLYARFLTFGIILLIAAGVWTFLNDLIDYAYGVFPYLPEMLDDDLFYVELFTFLLTTCSIIASAIAKFAFVEREKRDSF